MKELVTTLNRISIILCYTVIVAFFFAAGSSVKAAEKNLPIKGEVFAIEGRTAFLILPEKAKSGDAVPWIWYAPALKGLPGKYEKWMFEKFLDNGIAIAGVDVGESYGSPKGRTIYSALYKELVEKRGLAKQACLLARSRGGLMLYNWAAENAESVACIAGIYPVCNLSSYPGLTRACGAYGMTEEQLAAKLTEHNPIDRLAPLAKANVPIFHIHGDKDTVVPLDKNSAEVKKRYDKLGGKMTLQIVKDQGHNLWPGWFHSQKLVDFVITHVREDKPKEPTDVSATDLRCEYLTDPLGIDVQSPRLSWKLIDPNKTRGQKQTAYQIVVTSDSPVHQFLQRIDGYETLKDKAARTGTAEDCRPRCVSTRFDAGSGSPLGD